MLDKCETVSAYEAPRAKKDFIEQWPRYPPTPYIL